MVAGQLTVEAGGRVVTMGPGETVTKPAGMPHTFRNQSNEEVELIVEVRPAAHFEEGLRALYGLSRDGRMDPINFAMADQPLIPIFHPSFDFAARKGLVVVPQAQRRFNGLMVKPQ